MKLPRKPKREHVYLSDEQVWEMARQAGPDKGVVILLLAYLGLRWASWPGCTSPTSTRCAAVSTCANAVNVGGKVVVGTPKTHERRTIPLPSFLLEPLAAACRGKARDGIVFPASSGGYAKPPGVSTWVSGAVERFPRITPHDLRHTAASLAVSAGANVKAVQKMLWHASAAMALDVYADLFDRDAEAVADAHDKRLSGAVFGPIAAKLQPKATGQIA